MTREVGVESAERGSQGAIRLDGGRKAVLNVPDGSEEMRTGFGYWV